jgi:hypothetical protein
MPLGMGVQSAAGVPATSLVPAAPAPAAGEPLAPAAPLFARAAALPAEPPATADEAFVPAVAADALRPALGEDALPPPTAAAPATLELELVGAESWPGGGATLLEQPPLHNASWKMTMAGRLSMCRTSRIRRHPNFF